ncbi:MAG: serine hydrolase, partial [Myxococcales bacterium]|nr:serine hydrolase [Myxococcales bacterium]
PQTEPAADGAESQAEATPEPEPQAAAPVEDPWLRGLMAEHKGFRKVLADPERYRMQVLVTVIMPGEDGPVVVEHPYRVDAEYIYPASAIKTFAAVGALRTLAQLADEGQRVGLDTPLAYCETGRERCTIDHDESNLEGGTITVGHEIRKMQLVSNNVSFNRLYELVGHRELNEMMWALGFESVRIQHRMYGVQDPLAQRTTPRVELRPAKGKAVVIPERVSDLELPPLPFTPDQLLLGVAYIDDETHSRVDEPLGFAPKNYVSIRDLHRLALAIARPDLPGVPDLGLTPAHRKHLLASMTDNPAESSNPVYADMDNGLRYKTMIGGMLEELPITRLRYVGKAGRAYGFHLDNAYIEDTKTKRAMVVTAVAYANANGVLNDNAYEYDGITRPFLRNLGQVLARAVLVEGEGT